MQHWTKQVDLQTPIVAVSRRFARFLIRRWRKTKGKNLAASWREYEANNANS